MVMVNFQDGELHRYFSCRENKKSFLQCCTSLSEYISHSKRTVLNCVGADIDRTIKILTILTGTLLIYTVLFFIMIMPLTTKKFQ